MNTVVLMKTAPNPLDKRLVTMRNKKLERISTILGNTYGWLIAEDYVGDDKHRNAVIKCLCKCGKYTNVVSTYLISGKTRSCGCYTSSQEARAARKIVASLPEGEASFNGLYSNYRGGARRRNLPFELTKEEARQIFSQSCYYCGEEPKQIIKHSLKCNGEFIYNGIDRLDNSLGYTIANSVACCGTCNRAKRIMSVDEFRGWIEKVYSKFLLKKEI